jgi:hypothetical protein
VKEEEMAKIVEETIRTTSAISKELGYKEKKNEST